MRSTPLLAISALAALAGACSSSDFTEVSRLDRLRVLALRTEPVNPAQGETTTLEPLIYAPTSDPTSFAWSWCPVLGSSSEGYPCPLTDAEVAQLAAGLGATEPPPPLDLGGEPTPTYKNVFPAAALANICTNGFSGFIPDCDNGFPIRVKLVVTSGDETVTATNVVRLPIDDAPSNQNPVITGITATVDGAPQPVDDSAQVTLPRIADTALGALVSPDQSETYQGLDDEGNPATLRERLVLSWFAEAGDIDNAQTAFIDGKSDFAKMIADEIHISTVENDPGDTARIIVVLRDNRGGVSSTSGVVELGVEP